MKNTLVANVSTGESIHRYVYSNQLRKLLLYFHNPQRHLRYHKRPVQLTLVFRNDVEQLLRDTMNSIVERLRARGCSFQSISIVMDGFGLTFEKLIHYRTIALKELR